MTPIKRTFIWAVVIAGLSGSKCADSLHAQTQETPVVAEAPIEIARGRINDHWRLLSDWFEVGPVAINVKGDIRKWLKSGKNRQAVVLISTDLKYKFGRGEIGTHAKLWHSLQTEDSGHILHNFQLEGLTLIFDTDPSDHKHYLEQTQKIELLEQFYGRDVVIIFHPD